MDLASDCSRCFGLCCTALPFRRSTDFAFDKPADEPCRHLGPAYSCGVHDALRERGMTGCTVFECFGAGQRVSQEVYAGVSWRERPESAGDMFAAFARLRDLHEVLVLLEEAVTHEAAGPLVALRDEVATLAAGGASDLLSVDPFAIRDRVGPALETLSLRVRRDGAVLRRADLAGADLRSRDLRDADLRGALLIGADLRDVDLGRADLLGADLRGADLGGADLGATLFLTQPQANAAVGDARTRLPGRLRRPGHWV